MITAEEAKQLVEKSELSITKILKMFDEQVQYIANKWENIYWYKVAYERYGEAYVPRGLADDDGNGPHSNYGLIVSW